MSAPAIRLSEAEIRRAKAVGILACEMGIDRLPGVVYATRPTKMSWSAEDEIDHVLERLDFHDVARDEISAEAEKELQTYLDGWVDKYSPTVYFPDYSKKIVGWEAWLSPAEKESSDAEQE